MTTTAEKKTESPIIEAFKSECSVNGKKLLESAGSFAQFSKHDLGIQDIAIAIFSNPIMLTVLEEYLHIDTGQAMKSFVGIAVSGGNKDMPIGSIQDIFNVADKERMNARASKIRAGDIMVAILESQTTSGKALREALSPVKEKGVGFLPQLKNIIDQVEKPWEA